MKMARVFILLALLLSACSTSGGQTANATTAADTPAPSATPAPTASVTPRPHTTVDPSTMDHKLLMGYQGWFYCQGDAANMGWVHWFNGNTPSTDAFRVDMYPDMRELGADEKCKTDMHLPNGQVAYLYSALNPITTNRHFEWMNDYGIDGVFLQRFVSEIANPVNRHARNIVLQNVQQAAEANGRVFAIMYDTSGMDSATLVDTIEKDWIELVDQKGVTQSPAFLHHKGKPVVAIWGLGFVEHPGTPADAMQLANFFTNNPDPKYQATIVGGVPTNWRTLNADSLPDPAWMDYYCALDVLSPWTVGRYSSDIEVDMYKLKMQQDMAKAEECGVQYMPVVFPGTAFHNSDKVNNLFNATPRRGGRFYWRQVYNAVSIGVPMIYNAMFDEVDEDTAMYKIAETKFDQPKGADLVSMDADGEKLPSDWYLRLAGSATQMLRGQIPLQEMIPISSGAVPAPTPQGMLSLRIEIDTSSDWSSLQLMQGGEYKNMKLNFVSPDALNVGASMGRLAVGQSIAQANAGKVVQLVVDAEMIGTVPGSSLKFEIQSGAIGKTTIHIFKIVDGQPVEVATSTLYEMIKQFEVPVDVLTNK